MELSSQIKKYRTDMNLSQEELAEKVYVTRQTISNWENNKSYPDIHSLLLLSSVFNVSLDQLIKGDIQLMREEINKNEIQKLTRDSTVFAFLLLLFIVSIVPLTVFLGYYGLIISVLIYVIGMYYAVKIENFKKEHDIQTYKEIVAFSEGKKLDEITKAQEFGKRPYQKVLLAAASGIIAFTVCVVLALLLS